MTSGSDAPYAGSPTASDADHRPRRLAGMATLAARALNATVTATGQAVTAALTASGRALARAGRATQEILREQVRLPTVILMLVCVFVGIPVTVLLTPDQELTVVGQHLSVGARTPSLSISGPAQLIQIGNTQLDIEPLEVYGPLRPRLTLGPVQRNAAAAAALDPDTNATVLDNAVRTIAEGFLHWYLWATLILIGFALAATGIAASIRMLIALRRESRNHREPLSAAELWHRSTGQIRGMAVGAVLISLLAWGVCGALAYTGAVSGLREVTSLPQLVGRYYLSPSPVGPEIEGYRGAVIGDSRASRLGGPLVPEATAEDEICLRSTDSLAAEVGRQLREPVLNLACPGASVTSGLRGPQVQSDVTLPPQVGVLKQVSDLRFVVVVIGPNDLAWVDQLLYCYAVEDCQDALTAGEFEYRLAAFDRAYGDLLRDLNDLPGSPQVIIVTSYDVFDPERFDPESGCPDAAGPPGTPGLSRENVELLADRNQQLNDVLVTGAEKYGFTVADPVLAPLCVETNDQIGPDLQGLADAHPFHPTAVGMIRMAAAVTRVVAPEATE